MIYDLPKQQRFDIPDLPAEFFGERPLTEVNATTVEHVMERASTTWPQIDRLEVQKALATDFAQEDQNRALLLLQYYYEATRGNVMSIEGTDRSLSGSSSMLAQTMNLFSLTKNSAPPLSKPIRADMKGTQNFGGVTCYMSSTLVAMFSRMENFEPLLYQKFDDPETNELATWLRLFVNLLRSGEIVTKDILRGLLGASYKLGWCRTVAQGAPNTQQDAGEFFSFLTECLKMPLLSLRVEIAHAGREVAEDDHKVVTEQLLYLPVPGSERDDPILLEECLELYFANNISVSRPCDRAALDRRPTFNSAYTSLTSNTVPPSPDPSSSSMPFRSRHRSYSIVSQKTGTHSMHRRLTSEGEELTPTDSPTFGSTHRRLSSSVGDNGPLPTYTQLFGETKEVVDKKNQLWTNNNEITFPAWMFLQLMPFYAAPDTSEEGLKHLEAQQVAHHFERTRPVLGMCLKRFGYDEQGNSAVNTRQVIIPHTISLPTFVADDSDSDHAFGNFKLVLESVVFHKGSSSQTGHYTSMVRDDRSATPAATPLSTSANSQKGLWRRRSKKGRGTSGTPAPAADASLPHEDNTERWLLFDDQLPDGEKVQTVDFYTTMETNVPYLLFYRMIALEKGEVVGQKEYSYSSERLSPVYSPATSNPTSPKVVPTQPPNVVQTTALPSAHHSHGHHTHGHGHSHTHSHASSGNASSVAAGSSAPLPPAPEEKKRKTKGLFRKHKDKEYARAYREEKCKVM